MSKIIKLSLFVAAITMIVCEPIWAHGVSVFAWVEGNTVHVEGKFAGGRRPVDAPVKVYDSEENLLLSGVTDENGEFSFKVPRKTEMKVVLLAGMGHRGEWTIPLSDLEAVGSGEASKTAEAVASESITATGIAANTSPPQASSEYVTVAEVQKAIEVALDKKMKPMMKLLVDAEQSGPSMTDILGGIGYIFGLVGVAAYTASRRKKL